MTPPLQDAATFYAHDHSSHVKECAQLRASFLAGAAYMQARVLEMLRNQPHEEWEVMSHWGSDYANWLERKLREKGDV